MRKDFMPKWYVENGKYNFQEPKYKNKEVLNRYLLIDSEEAAKQWLNDCAAEAQKVYDETGEHMVLYLANPENDCDINVFDFVTTKKEK